MDLKLLQVAEWESTPMNNVPDGENAIADTFVLNCYAGRPTTSALVLRVTSKNGDILDEAVLQVGFKDGKMKLVHLNKVEPKADQA